MPEGQVELIRHPDSPVLGVTDVSVHWVRNHIGLQLAYRLGGSLDGLRLPAFAQVRPGERLWEHSCFEAFLSALGRESYWEFNFSPAGEWASYAFRAYRQAELGRDDPAPELFHVHRDGQHLSLLVRLAADSVPEGPVACGLSVVLESTDGSRAYWALRHADGAPDFHRRESFALALPE